MKEIMAFTFNFKYIIIILMVVISVILFFVFKISIKGGDKERLTTRVSKKVESLDLNTASNFNNFGAILPLKSISPGIPVNPPQCFSQSLPTDYMNSLSSSSNAIYTASVNNNFNNNGINNTITQNLTTDSSYCQGAPIASWSTDKGNLYVCSSFSPTAFADVSSDIPQYCWNITPNENYPGCYTTPNTTGTLSTCPNGMGCDNSGFVTQWNQIFSPLFTGIIPGGQYGNNGMCVPNSSDSTGANNSQPSQEYVTQLTNQTFAVYACDQQPTPNTCSPGIVTNNCPGQNVPCNPSTIDILNSNIPYTINYESDCPPGSSQLSKYSGITWENLNICLPG